MKEYSRSVLPNMRHQRGQGPMAPGPSQAGARISGKLSNGQEIAFWVRAEMPGGLIRPGTKVTLSDSGKPLADGAYRLVDGSEMIIHKGQVKRFDRNYLNWKEMMVAAAIGLLLIFLLTRLVS